MTNIDEIVALSHRFEKMAIESKKAPMGTPDKPDIRGMYTNINLLMDHSSKMTGYINDFRPHIEKIAKIDLDAQISYILGHIAALSRRVKALES